MRSILLTILAIAVFAVACYPQSRTNRLWRPCAGTTSQAKVEIESDGDINIVPCPTSDFLVNGAVTAVTGLSSLNGLIGATQAFGAPSAADTAAWSSAGTTHTLQLPITSVSGASRTNYFPYFDAANTLAKSPFKFQSDVYSWNNAAETSNFDMELETHVTSASGRFWVGDYLQGNSVYVALDSGNAYIGGTGIINVGDVQGAGQGTLITVTDSTQEIELNSRGGSTLIGDTDGFFANSTHLVIDGGSNEFLFEDANNSASVNFTNILRFDFFRTITVGGSTGNQTINRPSGTVNFAAAASSITVTNSTVNTSSIVFAIARTNDATCAVKNVVPGVGSFVINMTAACTAETSVGFLVTN